MENITLRDIVRVSNGRYFGEQASLDQPVTKIIRDHRETVPGALFCAFRGAKVDGHTFIPAALAAGAVAAMGEAMPTAFPYIFVENLEAALGELARWYRKQFSVKVIAVTGSVGKSTCKEMISSVLSQRFQVLKTEKNYNNALGLPLTLFELEHRHEYAVLELGISDFDEMHHLAGIAAPDMAVITNIGDSHLESLGDRLGVLQAKTELLDHLPIGASVYLNGDDSLLAGYQLPHTLTAVRSGTAAGLDIRAQILANDANGFSCRIGSSVFHTAANGIHLLYSILPAYAIGHDLGLSDAEIAAGVEAFTPLKGRGNVIKTARYQIIDHAYNANPNSMAAALDSLLTMPGRHVAILGDMYELGEQSRQLHEGIALYLDGKAIDTMISVGKLAKAYYDVAYRYGTVKNIYHFDTVEEALAGIPALLQDGDNILVKASHSLGLERVVAKLETC